MTRDEAKPALNSIISSMDRGLSLEDRRDLLSRGLSALGILKLDEPRISDFESELPHRYIGKVRSFMRKFGLGLASPIELERALDAAGLRIVEK